MPDYNLRPFFLAYGVEGVCATYASEGAAVEHLDAPGATHIFECRPSVAYSAMGRMVDVTPDMATAWAFDHQGSDAVPLAYQRFVEEPEDA